MIASDLKPAAAYLRRSTDRQERSLADQRKEIEHWAGQNGYRLVEEYVDDAVSGTSAKARAGFQRMIADAQTGKFTAILVWSSDRFSRSDVTETEHYRYLLRQAGVTLQSVTEDYLAREGIDGDVLRTVRQFQNRQYSISLSQNTLRGQISGVLGASDPGRMTPYGYDREIVAPDGTVHYRVRFLESGDREVRNRDGDLQNVYRQGQMLRKPGKECTARLVLSDPARVQVVKDIFQMCLDGRGFKGIADELNRRCILSPKGKLWQHTTIKTLIENPVYRGDIVWNRRTESKFYEVRQGRADKMKATVKSGRVERVSRDDWIVVENAVPGIVDRTTWERVQQAASARAECKGGHGRQEGRWLLSGVLRCGCCGHRYWGASKRKGRIAGRRDVVTNYYVCAGRIRSGKTACPASVHVRADELEAWVLAKLQEAVASDADGIEAAVDRFVEMAQHRRDRGPDSRALESEIAEIDGKLSALISGLDPANLALINTQLTRLRHRREALQRELRMSKGSDARDDKAALRRWARERISRLKEMALGRRDEKARQALASFVDEVVIDPATKTGYLTLNAGVPAAARIPSDGPRPASQKRRDPPVGGSQCTEIEGG